MALLVDLAGSQYGIELAEVSLEIQNHTVRVAPQFKTMAQDRVNTNKGFAVGPGRLTISQNGYITATSAGWWSFTFSAPCTIANDKTYFGVGGTGDVYLDDGEIVQQFDGLKTVSMNFSLDTEITGSGS